MPVEVALQFGFLVDCESADTGQPTGEAVYVDGVVSPANPHGCDDTASSADNPCAFHWTDDSQTEGPQTPAQRWAACHQLGVQEFCD